jgi:hypothetical protein
MQVAAPQNNIEREYLITNFKITYMLIYDTINFA